MDGASSDPNQSTPAHPRFYLIGDENVSSRWIDQQSLRRHTWASFSRARMLRMDSVGLNEAAELATALAVFLVAYQLLLTRKQLRASFERTFVDRYEAIIQRIPLSLLLGEHETGDAPSTRRAFYDYFELCEEELYYRATHRVSKATWNDWWEGIALHLQRSAFRRAWEDLSAKAAIPAEGTAMRRIEQFSYLRPALRAVDEGTHHDPYERRWWQLDWRT
jgi:hypothetical protein